MVRRLHDINVLKNLFIDILIGGTQSNLINFPVGANYRAALRHFRISHWWGSFP